MLFGISSVLPSAMRDDAARLGHGVTDSARGFVHNGQIRTLAQFLNIGTRKADFR